MNRKESFRPINQSLLKLKGNLRCVVGGGWKRGRKKKEINILKMIFSVGVSMYSEKVTSYWYRFRWRSLMSDEEDIAGLLACLLARFRRFFRPWWCVCE